eukprot:jgi/Botrbrau1/6485/Bobra.0034s0058.1
MFHVPNSCVRGVRPINNAGNFVVGKFFPLNAGSVSVRRAQHLADSNRDQIPAKPRSAYLHASLSTLCRRHPHFATHLGYSVTCRAARNSARNQTQDLIVWVQTLNQAVLAVALENGVTTFLFPRELLDLAESWRSIGKMVCMFCDGDIVLDSRMEVAGTICTVTDGKDLKAAEAECERNDYVIMDSVNWKIIPAENLVASFQGKRAKLLAMVKTAADAKVMLGALESGTHGVVLHTEDPAEVRMLMDYVRERRDSNEARLTYELAKIVRVQAVGMGDRVCVDLCSLVEPGAGLLVGSFARTLFLVQAECDESVYINSRPFRINAGPVHSYVAVPGGRTAYLSELRSGSEVLVADAEGRTRTALVGRCKIERRPMVLVEAETSDGQRHSLMLQNAETVKLMGPLAGRAPQADAPRDFFVPPVPPSISADGTSAVVLTPDNVLAEAAAAARSWAMNSHEDCDADDEECKGRLGGTPAPDTTTDGAAPTAVPPGTPAPSPDPEAELPVPQRLTRSESNLLEWVMHNRPEPSGSAASAPSMPGDTSGSAGGTASASSPGPSAQSAGPSGIAVGMVPGEGAQGRGQEAEGRALNGDPAGDLRRRRLSRENSRVMQWIMRDEGRTLTSEDLLDTLDVDEFGVGPSFLRQVSGGTTAEEASSADSIASAAQAGQSQATKEPNTVVASRSAGGASGPVAVTELRLGQQVYVLRQAAARHAGIGVIGVRILEC